jgi:hypothetical protein
MKRVQLIRSQLDKAELSNKASSKDTVTITDNRSGNLLKLTLSGKTFTYNLFDGSIKASDLEKIKDSEGNPLRCYDPAYMNTINCVNLLNLISRLLEYALLTEIKEF